MKNLLVNNLNHTGNGISKEEGKIIFIEKSIPGDIVTIKNKIEYKNYSKATIDQIITKSKDRIIPKCPYYNECGGCQIMAMNYEKQLQYKKEKVQNIFKKYSNLDINPNIVPSYQFGYRNKITLQVQNGIIGLFKESSNTIIEISECFLVSDKINNLIKIIKKNINTKYLNKIMIREATSGLMVVFYGQVSKNEIVDNLKNYVSSIYINSKCIYGSSCLFDKLDKYNFRISPESFYQVNKLQTINLYNQVKTYLNKANNIMDLYCGTGTIGIYVSDKCKKILGIEINKSAIIDANKNKEINNIANINFRCGSVGKLISIKDKYDAIIVDPPRSGLDKKTRRILLNILPSKIIYVSCDPMTLSRDIQELSSNYELEDITLFDMFPNTYHVESVLLLSLKNVDK